ncbi:MAG: Gldg family protein [Candidatus Omnitrophota bacterium]|nr:Gldg family protein [Candidatus Omnitrophota bacterium]
MKLFHFKNLGVIFKREFRAYFDSAIAYIYIIVFVLFFGALFMPQFFLIGQAQMRYFFDLLPIILCVFIPAITMRLWAEDRRGNTFELLLTFPMRPRELVVGKFLASFVFYLCVIAATLPVPIMIMVLGSPDLGPIVGGYIGAVLLGAFFIAIGIFISGICKDQIVAFILAMIGCFGFFLIGTEFIATFVDSWFGGFGTLLGKFFGLTRHYSSFVKGVVDIRDFLYFAGGTAIFLILNGFYIDGRMRPRYRTTFSIAVGLCFVIVAFFNWIFFDTPIGRFDLTQAKTYTVSKITKSILSELKAPVTVKFYISASNKMPTGFKTLEQDVLDKLAELREISSGKLNYKLFHMETVGEEQSSGKDEEESMEKQLERKGINPFQVRSVEADEMGVKLIYSAMALSYKEKGDEVIPQVIPDNLNELEYTLISKIYRLTMDKLPKIAIVAPYSEQKIDPKALGVLRQMGLSVPDMQRQDKFKMLTMLLQYEGYDVNRIDLTQDSPLDEDIDTLILVQPEKLNDRQRFEINKFLVGGGSLFLAVQNYNFDYMPSQTGVSLMPRQLDSGINSLITDWGVSVSENILMDLKHRVLNISVAGFGPFSGSMPVKLPIQIEVDHTGMNRDVSITSAISSIFYVWGSALNVDGAKIEQDGIAKQILLESSPDAWESSFPGGNVLKPRDIRLPALKDRSKKTLAVLLRGQFRDNFVDQPVPSWPVVGDQEQNQSIEEESKEVILDAKPGQLLAIGCSSMFDEDFFGIAGHRSFFLNSIDALTLGEDLIKVRSKVPVDISIGKVSGAKKIMWRFLTIFFIPIVIAIAGVSHLVLRRRLKNISL